MTPTYDIIIPHCGLDSRLTALCSVCLHTIRVYSAECNYRLWLIDNASPEGLKDLEPELNLFPKGRLRLVLNSVNTGFVKAVNQGLALSSAPYVVIMNNDTEAASDWLPRLQGPLKDTVGLCGPRTTTKGSWQGRYVYRRPGDPWILPNTEDSMLAFFCVMIRRDVLDTVGVLDERYGYGFADDSDYCRRAKKAGFRLALQQKLVIPHHHRSTFFTMFGKAETIKMQHEAIAKFKQKWN